MRAAPDPSLAAQLCARWRSGGKNDEERGPYTQLWPVISRIVSLLSCNGRIRKERWNLPCDPLRCRFESLRRLEARLAEAPSPQERYGTGEGATDGGCDAALTQTRVLRTARRK